jgi:hypothetical protein
MELHPKRQGPSSNPPTSGDDMTRTLTTFGDLISVFYEEFLAVYGDEELASLAAASVINDLISGEASSDALGAAA